MTLNAMYKKLYAYFGPQGWWPGETPFEVMIGAILTQNTNWENVEKAIHNLKHAKVFSLPKMLRMPSMRMARLIRPAGYFNLKSKRLKEFLRFLKQRFNADISRMRKENLNTLRQMLLQVNGIGPETADSILLYALDKPIFVVDAYTKRILERHKFIKSKSDYQGVQNLFMQNLKKDVKLFNEYHALLVRLGKDFCLKNKPKCNLCPLKGKK